MKKSDKLKQVLRQMIREEVARSVRQLIREEVSDQVNKSMGRILGEVLKESRTPSSPIRESVESEEVSAPVKKPTKVFKGTGNPALDAILTETSIDHTPVPGEGTSLTQLMAGDFEKIGKGEAAHSGQPATKMDFLKQIVMEGVQAPTNTSVTESPEVPDMLKKVFKRDFRKVMKAIDEKAKSGGSGLFVGNVSMSG